MKSKGPQISDRPSFPNSSKRGRHVMRQPHDPDTSSSGSSEAKEDKNRTKGPVAIFIKFYEN
jgi:hypothetical protein